jgi:hypothetical protein
MYNLLRNKHKEQDKYQNSGIYNIRYLACNKTYVGQTRRSLKLRFREHVRYIKTNNPQSAYALHVLNHCHQYGPIEETMKLLSPARKSTHMNCLESLYTNISTKRFINQGTERGQGESFV